MPLQIITEFVDPAHGGLDRVIPLSVLKRAQGFAIFSVARIGFLMSARAGSGVVIARLPDNSWSAPSALGLGGLGGGFNAGLDVTDVVVVLNSKSAVRSFMSTGSLQFGGNLGVAIGPLGRSAEASGAVSSQGKVAAMFSYSKSKGLYGGISLEGTVLVERSDANIKAYQRPCSSKSILSGSVDVPSWAGPLISTIEKFTVSGEVRAGMDGDLGMRGARNDEDDDNWYEDYGSGSGARRGEIDALDREFQASSLGNGNRRRTEDYANRRTGEYAFGSSQGGNLTNSPTKERKGFFGSTSSRVGTDYSGADPRDQDAFSVPSSSPGRNRSSSLLEDGGSYAYSGVRERKAAPVPASRSPTTRSNVLMRNQRGGTGLDGAQFPTHFGRNQDDDDDDIFGDGHAVSSDTTPRYAPNHSPTVGDYGGSTYNPPYVPRKKPTKQATWTSTDSMDSERDEITGARGLRSSSTAYSRSAAGSKLLNQENARRNGMDSLDAELQRTSGDHFAGADANRRDVGAGWRSDYGLPREDEVTDKPQRPQYQKRSSSTRDIWNRVRGNSRTTPPPNMTAETSSPRHYRSSSSRSPSPDLLGSSPPTTASGSASGGNNFQAAESQVIASFDFEAQQPDDISFKRGDVIDVIKRTNNREDWWMGRNASSTAKRGATVGTFPANFTTDV